MYKIMKRLLVVFTLLVFISPISVKAEWNLNELTGTYTTNAENAKIKSFEFTDNSLILYLNTDSDSLNYKETMTYYMDFERAAYDAALDLNDGANSAKYYEKLGLDYQAIFKEAAEEIQPGMSYEQILELIENKLPKIETIDNEEEAKVIFKNPVIEVVELNDHLKISFLGKEIVTFTPTEDRNQLTVRDSATYYKQ